MARARILYICSTHARSPFSQAARLSSGTIEIRSRACRHIILVQRKGSHLFTSVVEWELEPTTPLVAHRIGTTFRARIRDALAHDSQWSRHFCYSGVDSWSPSVLSHCIGSPFNAADGTAHYPLSRGTAQQAWRAIVAKCFSTS
jgi:hypothetical protein